MDADPDESSLEELKINGMSGAFRHALIPLSINGSEDVLQLGLICDRGHDISLVPELQKLLHVDCHGLSLHLLVDSLGVQQSEESEIFAKT